MVKGKGTSISKPKKDKKLSWSKSIKKDGITKELKVRQVENGFLIEKCKFGDIDGKWVDEREEYISKTNPLDESVEFKDGLDNLLESMATEEGMINV